MNSSLETTVHSFQPKPVRVLALLNVSQSIASAIWNRTGAGATKEEIEEDIVSKLVGLNSEYRRIPDEMTDWISLIRENKTQQNK